MGLGKSAFSVVAPYLLERHPSKLSDGTCPPWVLESTEDLTLIGNEAVVDVLGLI